MLLRSLFPQKTKNMLNLRVRMSHLQGIEKNFSFDLIVLIHLMFSITAIRKLLIPRLRFRYVVILKDIKNLLIGAQRMFSNAITLSSVYQVGPLNLWDPENATIRKIVAHNSLLRIFLILLQHLKLYQIHHKSFMATAT